MQQPWTTVTGLLFTAGGGTAFGLVGAPWWAVVLLVGAGLAGTFLVQAMMLVLPQDSADRTQLLLAWLRRRQHKPNGRNSIQARKKTKPDE